MKKNKRVQLELYVKDHGWHIATREVTWINEPPIGIYPVRPSFVGYEDEDDEDRYTTSPHMVFVQECSNTPGDIKRTASKLKARAAKWFRFMASAIESNLAM